jgi:ferredoxin
MSLRINADECIGCGLCMQICPDIFKLDEEEGRAFVVSIDYDDSEEEQVREAIDACPIGCISK